MLEITLEFLLPTMKVAYLLECYDVILRHLNSVPTISKKNSFDLLSNFEADSYRIYHVTITKSEGNELITVTKPLHSFHPKVQKRELLSIFKFTGFEKYIPLLQNHIEFTGEAVYFASDIKRNNAFYVYEKCLITELNAKELFFLYCNISLIQENQNIKMAIKEKVFKLKSKLKIEHYIHKNQLAIESQLNRLIKQINPETNNELYVFSNRYDESDCLKTIYYNLEKLLVFIEKEYNSYLDVNIRVPHRTILMNEYAINPKLNFVRDSIMALEINPELLKILSEPLVKLSTINIQQQITYYQFNYASEYISELAELLQESPNGVTEVDLCKWLLELNMNSFRFFDYKTNLIQVELNECESDKERLEFLYKKLKKFNQHRIKIKKSFIDNLPEIKVQICNWIEEEIEFINHKLNLEGRNEKSIKTIEVKSKILIGLSVAQLSYFINILMQTGIINHTNQRDVFRLFAENFRTKATDNISIDSLSSKFYNVETTTKNAIKEKIIELLNFTKK